MNICSLYLQRITLMNKGNYSRLRKVERDYIQSNRSTYFKNHSNIYTKWSPSPVLLWIDISISSPPLGCPCSIFVILSFDG